MLDDSANWFPYFANMYQSYRCNASKIKVWAVSTSGSLVYKPFVFFIRAYGANGPGQVMGTFEEATLVDGRTSYKHITGAVSQRATTMQAYTTTKRLLQLTKAQKETDGDLWAPINADPVDQWYWQTGIQDLGASASGETVIVHVSITYYTEFKDRVAL